MSTIADCVKPFHKHIMLRGHVQNPPQSEEETISWMRHLVDFLGMKILQGPFATYLDVAGNRGLTSVVMIETSHIAFHVWDEQEPALLQFDIYTCGSLDVDGVLEEMDKFFVFTDFEHLVYDREHGFELIESNTR